MARLLEAIEVLHTDVTPDSLFDRMSEAAARAVSSETACFDGFDPAGRIGHLGSYPQDTWAAADFPVLQAHLFQHPLFQEIIVQRRPEAMRTSDFCHMEQYFRTTLFNDFYRPYSLTHQLITGMDVPNHGWITCALNRRHRDFTEDERTIISLLRPHFVAAVRNALTVARLQQPTPATIGASATTGLARINATGSLLSCDPTAERLLRGHFGLTSFQGRPLPSMLLWWLHQYRTAPQMPLADFVHRAEHTELSVRLIPTGAGELLLLLDERALPSAAALQRLGLTPREAQVLFHLTQGLPDKAISQVCGISLRTTQNHLQNIYSKLNVDSRTAAVRWALA